MLVCVFIFILLRMNMIQAKTVSFDGELEKVKHVFPNSFQDKKRPHLNYLKWYAYLQKNIYSIYGMDGGICVL